MRRYLAITFFALVVMATGAPNFVVILADDLGYADLACYGNRRVATPHLDRLAAEGVRFTDFHANGPMCSPTRAALLTGRYPQRVGIEAALPLMAFPAKREGFPAGTVTVAQRLAAAGYATGLVGKWHLGHHPDENPVKFGFKEFRGLLCGDGDYAAQISRNGLPDWWENETLRPEPAILRWPGRIAAGTVSAATAATFDLAPTFLALAGGATPTGAFDGVDLSAHLLRTAALPERPLFWRIRGTRAARLGPWKLIAPRTGAPELYDLSADPGESRNRADDEPALREKLFARLAAWERVVDSR